MHSMPGDASALRGEWAHSFEEDQGNLRVYRPAATYAFPPSRRGREQLSFGADGDFTQKLPGPDDRPRHAASTALGMNRFRLTDPGSPEGCVVELVEATKDKLTLRLIESD